jgi:hypothetical protein
VSAATFTLRSPAGPVVPAAVTYTAATRTAILNPSLTLVADTRYTATLTGGRTAIRDAEDFGLATQSWSFTTGPGPAVTVRAPASRGTNAAPNGNVVVTFGEPVLGVDGTTFTLADANGAAVPATVAYNATTRRATLNPDADLAPDARYTATLTGGTSAVRDRAGNPLVTHSWSFTTGPGPSVTARTPGGTGVSRGANVTATFSEPFQGLGASTFMLISPAGKRVPAVIRWDAGTRTATLDPLTALGPNAR